MNPDDPILTAYALGELDAAERAALEARLFGETDALAEMDATRELGDWLRKELASQPTATLLSSQRAEIFEALKQSAPRRNVLVPIWRRPAVLSTLAACLVVGASMALLWPLINVPQPALVSQRSEAPDASFKFKLSPSSAPVPEEILPRPAEAPILGAGASPTLPPLVAMAPIPGPLPPMPAAGKQKAEGATTLVIAQIRSANSAPETADTTQWISQPGAVRAMPAKAPGKGVPSSMAGRMGGTAKTAAYKLYADAAQSSRAARGAIAAVGRIESAEPRRALTLNEAEALWADKDRRGLSFAGGDGDAFESLPENAFLPVGEAPVSTFSIDVDTASYANVRRALNAGELPPKDAVRVEELLNYFRYDYPATDDPATPFSAAMEVAACPWSPAHRLVRIGLHGREMARSARPAGNLVFLIDVSGSMQPEDRLPLLKRSMQMLVDQLGENDRVSIVVYAGASGCVLQPTRDKAVIRAALDKLESGGSTNGASGIQLAYQLARKSFIPGGINRVLLATDGDFNVGITDRGELTRLIEQEARSGVFLTVLGFGSGNLKDATLEKLADKGNGNYACIDSLSEGRRVLVEQINGTLVTIAKDVKIQVEFNPAQVAAYRLIGYENRLLARADFNDDKKDAGEIGAGHMVTALYEVIPAGGALPVLPAGVEPLKYQPETPKSDPAPVVSAVASPEMLTLKLRFKAPESDTSALREFALTDSGATWEKSSRDFRFAAAVAGFGMLLRDSAHRGNASWESVLEWAAEGRGDDREGYRAEFVGLVEKAKALRR